MRLVLSDERLLCTAECVDTSRDQGLRSFLSVCATGGVAGSSV
jgi:hypothetical protein